MRKILKILVCIFPWKIKRLALNSWFGYEIHPTAYIGLAWIFPQKLVMGPGAKIDHFTVAIHLDLLDMDENAMIGRSNWITGFPTGTSSPHFRHQPLRRTVLKLGRSSTITKKHHLDCTNTIQIGAFSTIAGYSSQFLTHSINVFENRQECAPIYIGDYTFIGTNVVVLGGSKLPSYSVLGAKALLNKNYKEEWMLYGQVPAIPLGKIPRTSKYFTRETAVVY